MYLERKKENNISKKCFYEFHFRLSFAVIKSRALQICYGVKSLHDQKISHGDLSVFLYSSLSAV